MPPTAGSSTGSDPLSISIAGDEPAMPAFYLDLRSPEAYLAAERVLSTLPYPAEWIPIRSRELPAADALDAPGYRESVEQRAARDGLQRFIWPKAFPADDDLALLAATYAKGIGRVVAYCLAAFRQAFAGGRDLSDPDTVVIAGSACEMHPTATLKAVETRGVRNGLARATELAVERGVRDVPAIWLPDGRVFHGEAALGEAAAARPGDA